MGARRGRGEGCIYRRHDGYWIGQVNLGFVSGTRKRKTVTGKTRKEVSEKMKALLRDQQQGLPIQLEQQTVQQFLTGWLADVVRPHKRPKTSDSYAQVVRLYLIPALGRYKLARLTPEQV